MAFSRRNLALEMPGVLQDQRLFLDFVFVPDNVSGIRRRYAKNLLLHIGDQLASLDLRERNLHGILVLHFIIFALRGDAPAMQARDLLGRIEGNCNDAVLPASGPENLVGLPHLRFDLVNRYHGDVLLRIQQHGIRLLVVRGERRIDLRVHPLRRITHRDSPRHAQQNAYRGPGENQPCGPVTDRPPCLAVRQSVAHLPSSLLEKSSAVSGSTSCLTKES